MSVRSKFLKLRVTDEERAQIKQKAGGISTSAFLRQLALEQPIQQPLPKAKVVIHSADPELVRAVGWIGNNINQIAKHLNSGNATDNSILLKLIEIQTALDDELKRVMTDDR